MYSIMNEREQTFWWHSGMKRIIACLLAMYAPRRQGNSILDAGCGTGGMFSFLSSYGEIYGIDQSSQAIYYAQQKRIAQQLFTGSISSLPFASAMFDAVFCLDVLYHQHAGNDTQALREFHRVMKKGGILIIREPAYNFLRGHHDRLVWTRKRYTKKELIAKLQQAGFEIQKASYINFFLFPLAAAKRLLERVYAPRNVLDKTFHSHKIVNAFFEKVLFLEAILISHLRFPYGLSVICVAKK